MSPDVAASVRARLLRRAHEQGEQYELVLVRYACERFLYRLGQSSMRERCVVKGAALLTLWMDDPYRSTRDVDLLAFGSSDEASVRSLVESVCRVPCPEDALSFDRGSLEITAIRPEEEYQGQRVRLWARLGKARIRFQVDIGFGDAVTPGPQDAEYPTLIAGMLAPSVRTYPLAASVAEKFESMVKLGESNSRMKDFHDIWALSSAFAFDGAELRDAVAACFARRGTVWTAEGPVVLGAAFYALPDAQARWNAYPGREAFRVAPPTSFAQIGEAVRALLGPIRECIVADSRFDRQWTPGGPWR